MTLKNHVQLIVYPDSLGGDLVELHYVLRRYLSRAIGGIHLLPFYPSSADRGFAPLTYDEVDPAFGTWRDIDLIGREFDLIIDFMVIIFRVSLSIFKIISRKDPNPSSPTCS